MSLKSRGLKHTDSGWLLTGNHGSRVADVLGWACMVLMILALGLIFIPYSTFYILLIVNPLLALVAIICGAWNRNVLLTFFVAPIVGFIASFGLAAFLLATP